MSASPTIEKSVTNPPHLSEKRKSPELKEPDSGADHEERAHGVEWTELVRISFVALAAAAVWFRLWEPFTHFSVIGIVATLIGGYPIFKEAFEKHSRTKNDDGTLDDHRASFSFGDWRVLHRIGHHWFRPCRRGSGRPHRRPRPSGHPESSRFSP